MRRDAAVGTECEPEIPRRFGYRAKDAPDRVLFLIRRHNVHDKRMSAIPPKEVETLQAHHSAVSMLADGFLVAYRQHRFDNICVCLRRGAHWTSRRLRLVASGLAPQQLLDANELRLVRLQPLLLAQLDKIKKGGWLGEGDVGQVPECVLPPSDFRHSLDDGLWKPHTAHGCRRASNHRVRDRKSTR